MQILEEKFKNFINSIRNNRFITIIDTDSVNIVQNCIEQYYASYLFGFSHIKTSFINNLSQLKKSNNKKDGIIFISDYVFSEENNKFIRAFYDNFTSKLVILPKHYFDYSTLGTQLSGRVQIVKYYCFKYMEHSGGRSFQDYILNLSNLASDNHLVSPLNLEKKSYDARFEPIMKIYADSIGVPLSFRDIMASMESRNNFLHPRMAPGLIGKLIDNKILIPCRRYDVNRDLIVSTNILYFFNSNLLLKKYLNNCSNRKMLANAFFLELFYRFEEVFYLKFGNTNFSFLAKDANHQEVITLIYSQEDINNELIKSVLKNKINARRVIVSIGEVAINEAYGIRIVCVDDYLNED